VNQIKPYLFWIVSGVALLVLLVLGLFVLSPVDESIDGTTRDAYEVKALLDTESRKLKDLSDRAKRGDPNRVFDPQVEADIKTLTNDYLLTKEWKSVIDPHVEKYDLQLKALRQDLVDRSAVLAKEVSSDHGKLPWYTAYQSATAELVARLRDAGALLVTDSHAVTAERSMPSQGGPMPPGGLAPPMSPAGGTTGGTAQAGDDPLDPRTGKRIRDVLGLLTTTNLPESTEHPLLTKRFRVAESVAGALLASESEALPNPVVNKDATVRGRPSLVAWEWKSQTEGGLVGSIADYAAPMQCTVTLQGSESALVAALAAIESLDRPVVIVIGSTFARIERAPPGSRKTSLITGDPVVGPASLVVDLLVLDFGGMPDLTSSAGAEPAGMGGTPGAMPPAINGWRGGPGRSGPSGPPGSEEEGN
jgi:hypothetical protein